MEKLVKKDDIIYVNSYALEIYLPADYMDKAYRGTPFYSLIGTQVKFFGVGNMRFYQNEKEMSTPSKVTTYPLGFPMIITSEPTEIDIRNVRFTANGPERKCIVLTYYKDDKLMATTKCIINSAHVMMWIARLEGGKLDHLSPETTVSIHSDVQKLNKASLKIPTELEEILIAERYRDPNDRSRKARFSNADDKNSDRYVSLNYREEAMKTSTYQATMYEDFNTALISSINRKNHGITDDPTIMERVVRGMDLNDLIQERDELAQESEKK